MSTRESDPKLILNLINRPELVKTVKKNRNFLNVQIKDNSSSLIMKKITKNLSVMVKAFE
jgi:hypothetical protein